jgi:hypothetical protein
MMPKRRLNGSNSSSNLGVGIKQGLVKVWCHVSGLELTQVALFGFGGTCTYILEQRLQICPDRFRFPLSWPPSFFSQHMLGNKNVIGFGPRSLGKLVNEVIESEDNGKERSWTDWNRHLGASHLISLRSRILLETNLSGQISL